MTIIISLNCCIYWAVRRARIERWTNDFYDLLCFIQIYFSRYARQEERDSREADETVPGKNNIISRGFI